MAMYACLLLAVTFGIATALDITGSIEESGDYYVIYHDLEIDYRMDGKRIVYEIKVHQDYSGMVMTAYNKSMISDVYDPNVPCETKIEKAAPYKWPIYNLPCRPEGDYLICSGDFWLEAKYGYNFQMVLFNCNWGGIKVERYYFSDTGMVSAAAESTRVYSMLGLIMAAVVAFV